MSRGRKTAVIAIIQTISQACMQSDNFMKN
jgi:hypothetical protein